ncbi:hypothetical protein [Oceanobacillus sp. CFH 90083]|uniref:hypothetical protein n=1 Tax=Oceanobacillus sp. CFH 90083 TaxID=2592336 RepID=UPI00272EC010|nr:hypothetical protein [Oceanobacillus sp. CFH 90083]
MWNQGLGQGQLFVLHWPYLKNELIEQALFEKPSTLTDNYHLVVSYEHVNWTKLDHLTAKLNLNKESVFSTYRDAQEWVEDVIQN